MSHTAKNIIIAIFVVCTAINLFTLHKLREKNDLLYVLCKELVEEMGVRP